MNYVYYGKNYGVSLSHHGILGQKWGVRRFQNEDGSLTPAGEKRYLTNVDSAKSEYEIAKKEYKSTMTSKGATQKDLQRQAAKVDMAKRKLSNEKIKDKLNKETSISKSRQSAIDKYKSKGMSDEEAEIAAYKSERTKR